jgi:hypothetical protein
VHELEPDEADQLLRVTTELRNRVISSDEFEEMHVVIELAGLRDVSATDVLEFFAAY